MKLKQHIQPRLNRQGYIKTHTDLYQTPEIIDLTSNLDCNLSCSYCCKEFSSSWRKDIARNGDYKITGLDDRYSLTNMDRVFDHISQPKIKSSKNYQLLLNEVKIVAPAVKKLFVTGGEPLLDNYLIDILNEIPFNTKIDFNLLANIGNFLYKTQQGIPYSFKDRLKSISDKGFFIGDINRCGGVDSFGDIHKDSVASVSKYSTREEFDQE